MLRHNADASPCSYFELGLPVYAPTPKKVVVMVFAISSCIHQFFVIVRRHLVRILSTFQLRARLQNSRVFFFLKWFRVEQEQRKSLTRANMRTRKAREKKKHLSPV